MQAFDERTYIAYNDAIFEYFFNQDRAGFLTTLAFDDHAASQIATELAVTGLDLTTRLCGMVGSLINPIKQDPYGFWSRRNPRLSTALLSCAVLVMSRLGSETPGESQQRGFHSLYNHDILGENTANNVPAIQLQDELWRRFAAYLDQDEGGQLGRLVFLPLLKYKHLNYPASQCLVRVTDRRRLQSQFQEFLDPSRDIDRGVVARLLHERPAGLTIMLQRAVSHLDQHDELSDQMWQIIEGEYEIWRAAPEQVAKRVLQRRQAAAREYHHGELGQLSSVARRPVATNQSQPVGPESQVEAEERFRPARPRPQLLAVTSRLALIEAYRLPAKLYVEVKPVSENDLSSFGSQSADGWIRLPEEVGADDFCNGFERIFGSNRLREYGRSLCAFGRTDYGWIETERLSFHTPVRIVYDEQASSDLQAVAVASSEHKVIDMADATLHCISVTLKPDVTGLNLPPSLSDILSESLTIIRLTSGLRLRSGRYLADGPPDLIFIHPTAEVLDVYFDGIPVGVATREAPFKIDREHCSPGRHVVCVGDQKRSFVIADIKDVEEEAQDASIDLDTDLGTIVARHPPRMKTSTVAEAMRTTELGRLNAVVVVGADLLLPYSRAILSP